MLHFCIIFYHQYHRIGKHHEQIKINNEMKAKLQHKYVRSNILNNGQLLVLFMYNTQEVMRFLRIHPQSLVADCTHGTNSERKELFTIVGVDEINNTFNAYRTYIPSLQSWVFDLLFGQCIPLFFGNTIISRVKLLSTDSAMTEYVPYITNIGRESPFVNSCHVLCYYDLAVQVFQRNVSPSIPNNIRSDVICNEYIKLFRFWVKSYFFKLKQKLNIITHVVFIQMN